MQRLRTGNPAFAVHPRNRPRPRLEAANAGELSVAIPVCPIADNAGDSARRESWVGRQKNVYRRLWGAAIGIGGTVWLLKAQNNVVCASFNHRCSRR